MVKYTKEEIINSPKKIKEIFLEGINIYPTDSFYAIGCDATNTELVDKLREIKKIGGLEPFTIIAPSVEWVKDNFKVDKTNKRYVDKLDKSININGKDHCLTLILELKNKDCVAPNVAPGLNTLAVKIPEHWISDIVKQLGVPIICSSANAVGENLVSDPEELSPEIVSQVNNVIKDNIIKIKPNTIIRPYGYKQ